MKGIRKTKPPCARCNDGYTQNSHINADNNNLKGRVHFERSSAQYTHSQVQVDKWKTKLNHESKAKNDHGTRIIRMCSSLAENSAHT